MQYMELFVSFVSLSVIAHIPKVTRAWGESCPFECECNAQYPGQTSLSSWESNNSLIKSALCALTNESLPDLSEVPQDTVSLTILQASDDKDMILTHEHLKGFVKLNSVDIQGSLTAGEIHISNDIFHGLDGLRAVSLQRIKLTGAEKALAKLPNIEVLHIIHCNIGYLKWEMLDGLKSLKELHLQESGIKELKEFAFYGTPELRRLFLSHNDLFSVEADAFVGLLKLEYLDLSNNRIDHLSGLTFPPLPHLQYLELKHNPIKVIFPHCFQFLNGTQHLTLGHERQPVHLMKFSFRGLYSLLYLHIPNIDNDALFEHMFYDLRSLVHLNLRGRVKYINNRAFNGAHKLLTKLVLQDCKTEKVFPDSFYGLEKLEILDLSENRLRSLPEGVFKYIKSVQTIFLNNNHLIQIPDEMFFALHSLKGVSLFNNSWECSCQMQYWKKEMLIGKYEEIVEKKCNSTECSNGDSFVSVVDIMPRCKSPEEYKGLNVFDALELLVCGNPSNESIS